MKNAPNHSEITFHLIAESAPNALILVNKDGKIAYVNAQAERLFGYTRNELMGQTIEMLIPTRYATGHPEVRDKFFDSPLPRAMGAGRDLFAVKKDKTEFPVEIGLNPLVTVEGTMVLASVIDISERKKFEAHRELFASIIDSSDDAIISKDLDGLITSWNMGAQKLFGYTAAEITGHHISALIPLNLRSEETEIMSKIKRGENIDHYETERKCKDGKSVYVSLTISPVKDAFGRITGASKIARDITSKKKADAEILKLNRLYSFLSAINKSIVHEKDEESLLKRAANIAIEIGKFKFARLGMLTNEGMRSITGTQPLPEELQWHSNTDFSRPPNSLTPTGQVLLTGNHSVINDLESAGETNPLRYAIAATGIKSAASFPIKKYGKPVGVFNFLSDEKDFFDAQEIALLDEAAGDIGFALETFENNALRAEAEKATSSSQANLMAIIESTDASIYSLDKDFKYLTFNSVLKNSLKQAYGLDVKIGDVVFDFLKKGDPQEAQDWEWIYTECLSGKTVQFTKEFHFPGQHSFINFSIHPIWENGHVTGLSCFARDITQQKLAEAEVKLLNESLEIKVKERTAELQQANKALESFNYTVSHDLQAPIRALNGFSKILLNEYKDKLDQEGVQHLNVIGTNARRMSELINDLLRFSKVGKDELKKQRVDMKMLAGVVIQELKANIINPKTQIEIQDLIECHCDSALMKQVWFNLIGNAIKYSSKKEQPVIEIGCEQNDNEIIYYVKDNGAGFDMKYTVRLFNAFQRLHSLKDFEGTGVGLATVNQIVTRHEGRVWADGKPGEGASFYFTVPKNT